MINVNLKNCTGKINVKGDTEIILEELLAINKGIIDILGKNKGTTSRSLMLKKLGMAICEIADMKLIGE